MNTKVSPTTTQDNVEMQETADALLLLPHLSDELWRRIFYYLPAGELLTAHARVDTRFATLLGQTAFWKSHPLLPTKCLGLFTVDPAVQAKQHDWTLHQLQRAAIFATSTTATAAALRSNDNCNSNMSNSDATPTSEILMRLPACLHEGSMLPTREQASCILNKTSGSQQQQQQQQRQRRAVCLASTTDHQNEMLENVLLSSHQQQQDVHQVLTTTDPLLSLLWWSSKPCPTQFGEDEILVFATKCPAALLTAVQIKALRDPFNRRIVYTWKQTRIQAYQLPSQRDNNNNNLFAAGFPCSLGTLEENDDDSRDNAYSQQMSHRFAITALLKGHDPVYDSAFCPGPANDKWQTHTLAPPTGTGGGGGGVAANIVVVTLRGKNCRQFQTSGYFACIEKIMVRGIPLYTSQQEATTMQEQQKAAATQAHHRYDAMSLAVDGHLGYLRTLLGHGQRG